MNYNKIFTACGVTVVTLLIVGIYFFGNAIDIMQHEVTEEIPFHATELGN